MFDLEIFTNKVKSNCDKFSIPYPDFKNKKSVLETVKKINMLHHDEMWMKDLIRCERKWDKEIL